MTRVLRPVPLFHEVHVDPTSANETLLRLRKRKVLIFTSSSCRIGPLLGTRQLLDSMAELRNTLKRLLRRKKARRPNQDRHSFSTEASACLYRFGVSSTPHLVATGYVSNRSTPSFTQQEPTSAQGNHESSIQQVSDISYRELPYFQDLPLQYRPRPQVEGRDSGSNYSNSIAEFEPDDQLLPASPATSKRAVNCLATKQVSEEDLKETGKATCAICKEDVPLGSIVKSMPCQHWYHGECIKQWLERGRENCPQCRDLSYPHVSNSSEHDSTHKI